MASTKEKIWLEEFFKCGFNATEAARRAGYAQPNKRGPEKLIKFDDVISERLASLAMDADEALARLSEIARGEWGKYVTPNGLLNITQLINDGKGYLVKKVRETKDGREYEFYDAQRALETVAKHHGLLTERLDLTSGGKPFELRFSQITVETPPDDDDAAPVED